VGGAGKERPAVWWAAARLPDWAGRRAELAASLSAAERARAGRFADDGLRGRFEIGRGLARLLLGRFAGIDPARVEIAEDPAGRPRLAAADPGIDFNITHSGDHWAMALARGARVGIDLESPARIRDPLRIAERFFAPAETNILRTLPDDTGRRRAFCRLWAGKEAVLKGDGCGISGGLAAVDLAAWLREGGRATVAFGGRTWTLLPLESLPGTELALAVSVADGCATPWDGCPERIAPGGAAPC
jgi:4'-phosphopantetheinyl transferase